MKKYFSRVLGYFVFLVILVTLLYLLLYRDSIRQIGFADYVSDRRNILMWLAIAGISLAYPFFGFTRRLVAVNTADPRETILKVMDLNGFVLKSETGGTLVFKARSVAKKMAMFGSDRIEVTLAADNKAVIEGKRREVAVIAYRAESFMV